MTYIINNLYFDNISNDIKDDKQFILYMIKTYPEIISYASNQLLNDPDIILEAIKYTDVNKYDTPLCYASKELRNNFNVVLAAVKKDGFALEFASYLLKNNY